MDYYAWEKMYATERENNELMRLKQQIATLKEKNEQLRVENERLSKNLYQAEKKIKETVN